jgi:tetratricopeptide (TPR) repeat protein
MYLFLTLLLLAPGIAGQYIIRFMPEGMQFFLFGFAKAFYTLVSYHLMGYVILQYHERIGYEIDFEDFEDPTVKTAAPSLPEDGESEILRKVEVLIQQGDLAAAAAAVQEATRDQGIRGLALSERYFNLLRMLKRSADMLACAPDHLRLLVASNQGAKAIEVYLACLEQDGGFMPDASTLLKIAGMFGEKGRAKEAIAAYSRFAKAFANHPAAPVAYFRAAQVFHDRLMNPAKSKQILQGILNRYPGHEIIPQVRNYLASI